MLSQEEVEEWWEWKWKEEWERQLWEWGYAELEDEGKRTNADDRMILISESRWSPVPTSKGHCFSKSPLWDQPSTILFSQPFPDKKKRRYVRLHMPEQLAQWKARQRRRLVETASQSAQEGTPGPLTREEG